MNPFVLISEYFWVIAIIVTFINWAMFRKRAKKHIDENPELKEGYEALFWGYIVWMNIPWVVMGIGCTVGGVSSVWHYFRPRDGNPYVLAWFASVFLLWVSSTFWLLFRGGAEKLIRHPGAMEFRYGFKSKDITNPTLIKSLWLLALIGGVIAAVAMWSMDIPIPNFR
jgi:hypothetical protein